MEIAFLLIGVLLGVFIGFLPAYVLSQRKIGNVDDLKTQLSRKDTELESQKSLFEERLCSQKDSFERLLESEKLTKEKLQTEFRSSAAQSLQESTKQFLSEAIKDLRQVKTESDESLDKKSLVISEMVKDIKERIGKSEELIKKFENERSEIYGNINQRIQSLIEAEGNLRDETRTLKHAIQGSSQARGQWGEAVLKGILDQSGLVEGVHYTHNLSSVSSSDRSRPDILIHINKSNNENLVIDSKANLSDFFKAVESEDQQQRKVYAENFKKAVRNEIRNLSSRNYASNFNSKSNVIMFIPTESAVRLLFQVDPEVFNYAIQNGITIASPVIIIPLIQVIHSNIQTLKVAEEIEEYKEAMRILAERLIVFQGHFAKLQSGLRSAVQGFQRANSSWDSRVMPQVRTLEGLSPKFKEFKEIESIDTAALGDGSDIDLFE